MNNIDNLRTFFRDIEYYVNTYDWVSAKRMARSLHKAIIEMEKEERIDKLMNDRFRGEKDK